MLVDRRGDPEGEVHALGLLARRYDEELRVHAMRREVRADALAVERVHVCVYHNDALERPRPRRLQIQRIGNVAVEEQVGRGVEDVGGLLHAV